MSKIIDAAAIPEGLTPNGKGVTIAVRKRGGWTKSWDISQRVAGWI